MKKLFLIPLFAAFFSFTSAAFAQGVDTSAPDTLVKTATQQVIDAVRADKSIQQGDISAVTKLVNEKILPYTDFHRTTQLAMGRNWRTATPEQQAQIVEQFKMLLIRTYSGALAQVRNQEIQYRPFRSSPDDTDVVVRSVVMNNGSPVELDYRLYKTPQGWRVYDINVLGAWLIQAYQQQFNEQIQQHGVDGLIQFLTQRNQQLAAGKQS
ncbi:MULTISPECIES: phospholipid-binding protein MlaC [Paraburkholderia]|uniref:Phospholipid transport system substrate-binding protein n=1 Tax=Paraburkholderia megapolitana TaxID=420953 RepID=A0A1I3VAW2_9BURK|nr:MULTISPECIES: ABC transporter substrate-binding protein [Paraburkholderia]MCX4165785.1 ABC transporter substrate-binding protein [Paraburkholderia megapolitana]MDN7161276.1 ABC transporter substrate-binding protein [Paraburkholderia sp. CHISQ3]MDQ6498323.1 ABC transporter substrate-binding protein [Paraburkholderia megapolitana]QDQ85518.1 ABC transporter substrate-binding protein [Paraburkholderia megapolitana]SFJ92119.1 phospholipid transport system substrate-binding protein [Paraburkholde